MAPKVSIITINYNNISGLDKTVRSVIQQSFKDFEFIVIDGGSKDGSLDIIKSFKEKITFWVSEKDKGIYNAMNKGIAQAKGDYLLFLNSGDSLTSPNIINECVNHSNFKGDIIYGDYQFENGFKKYPDTLYPTYFMKTSLPHQSTFFKREVFELLGNYDESYKIGADRAFYIKAYLSKKLIFTHIPIFVTLFDLSGMSNDPGFLERKRAEDQRLLKESYGEQYEFYKVQYETEIQRNNAKRNSFLGILKRIKKRIVKWMA